MLNVNDQIGEMVETAKVLRDRVAETRGQMSDTAQSKLAAALDKLDVDVAVAETEDALAEEADATDTTEGA